jgi:uncharacterized membrane protein YcaP (DUF421 family)
LYQRGLNLWAFKSRRGELILQGDVKQIVKDGCMDLEAMRHVVLSRERLFAILRQQRLVHLGEVKRVYLEADGHFSVYTQEDPPPGLCLLPAEDNTTYEKQYAAPGVYVCRGCGNLARQTQRPSGNCQRCGEQKWSPAVQAQSVRELKPEPALVER